MNKLPLALPLLFLTSPALAVDLSGDRPDFTEGTGTVPTGALQLEGGFNHDVKSGVTGLPELLLRSGLGEVMELRVAAPSLSIANGNTETGAAGLGVKYVMALSDAVNVGVLPSVSAPVAGGFGDQGLEVGLGLLWSWDSDGALGLSGSLGTAVSGVASDAGQTANEHFTTLSVGLGISDEMSVFAETYALIGEEASFYADGGLLYLISPTFQIDVYAGVPLEDPGAAWVGAGVVTMFGGE